MQYTVPHYYKKFQCIAGECPDTCCAGWQIQIDPASLRKYKKTKGPLGSRLRNEIDWKEAAGGHSAGPAALIRDISRNSRVCGRSRSPSPAPWQRT